MTTEEKFNAAVNVIRSLPKNGSYQPSNELMLRFYSYFKQATQGPCSGTRPGFWDIVGRAKYDAWKRLGDMSRNEAMRKYVDELHSIVETMSYSDKVANFLEAPTNELDGINIDDLELVAGDVLERVRSQPNSPLASREGSPIRFLSSVHSSRSASPSMPTEDESEDEYLEPFDGPNVHDAESEMEANLNYIPNGIDGGTQLPYRPRRRSHTCTVDISREVAIAVENLRLDVLSLDDRIHVLESLNKRSQKKRENIFGDVVPELIAFMVLWPFLACFIVNRWMLRRK